MFFRKCRERALDSDSTSDGEISEDEYAYFHTLCTVWPDGPMAQAFMKNPTPLNATLAAAEIRKDIEASFYAEYELGQDWIAFLRRVEG